jgi:hypothetical protein
MHAGVATSCRHRSGRAVSDGLRHGPSCYVSAVARRRRWRRALAGGSQYRTEPRPRQRARAGKVGVGEPSRASQMDDGTGDIVACCEAAPQASRLAARPVNGTTEVWTHRFRCPRLAGLLPFRCLLRQLAPLECSQVQQGTGTVGAFGYARPSPCNGHPRRTGTNNASTVVLFRISSASAELAASKTSNPAARSRSAFAERKTAFFSTTKTTDFSGRGTEAPRG